MATAWMDNLGFRDGLFIPGSPYAQAVDLLLAPDGIHLSHGTSVTTFAWHHHRAGTPDTARRGWAIEPVGVRGGSIGHSLVAGSAFAPSADPVGVAARASMPWLRRLQFESRVIEGVVYPLEWTRLGSVRRSDLIYPVDALCTVIAERPAWQERLDDAERIRLLAAELSVPDTPLLSGHGGFHASEIAITMGRLGFRHRHGRPLPGDAVPAEEDVTAAILREMPSADPELVQAVARSFTDAPPWPFAALAD